MSRASTFNFQLGLIGYPLGHSLSPSIQTSALQSSGLEGDYVLFPISPDDRQGLKDLLDQVRAGEIQGLNVTIPHKQNVIPYLDKLMPTAESIGAVNTIYLREEKLIGENTDAPGFLADLKKFLTTHLPRYGSPALAGGARVSRTMSGETQRHGELHALVLGAGGSARAIIYALLKDGWKVTMAARRLDQAQQLADTFAHYQLPITAYPLSYLQSPISDLQSPVSNISLLVNTTPVGMTPNADQSPWPENIPFPPHAAIYDLVYNPPETKLVRAARHQGRPATTGLGMLIEQAALAFEIWTGQNPSRELMRASAEKSLVSSHQSAVVNPGAL